jgi:DNA-binding MarR family transcriptional regulator
MEEQDLIEKISRGKNKKEILLFIGDNQEEKPSELYCNEIATHLEWEPGNTCNTLRPLRKWGVVKIAIEPLNNRKYYSLTQEGLKIYKELKKQEKEKQDKDKEIKQDGISR